jgi:hypothetical protein
VAGQGAFGNADDSSVAAGDPGAAPVVDPEADPFVRDDTALAGLDPAVIDRLRAGGGACPAPILYPAEGTVFPGGLLPPPIMWTGATEAAYARVSYEGTLAVDYQYAAAASDPGELRFPQDAWNEITRRVQNAPLVVTVSVLASGAVTTCETRWRIAPGNMTGSVYFNTYSAPGAMNPDMGAVMRLKLGQPHSDIYLQYPGPAAWGKGPCISCHSVSFNGSTIVASTHEYTFKTFDVFSYPVSDVPQPPQQAKQPNAVYGALTPDGTRMLSMGNPDCTAGSENAPRSANNFPIVEGPSVATVLDTATGQDVGAGGLDPAHYMWMPQFSPDGTKVVFNHAKPDGKGGTDRRELAVMDYDQAANMFSNLRVVVSRVGPEPSLPYAPQPVGNGIVPTGIGGCTDPAPASADPLAGLLGLAGDTGAFTPGTCTGPCYPAWPFFTPDGRGVVFALMNEPDFASAFPGRDAPAQSELWYVDVETLETVRLDAANRGVVPNDALSNYYPTVLPVQVGGYFWVFWTSKRAFGHHASIAALDALNLPVALPSDVGAISKRIWVSAIRARGPAGDLQGPLVDPSAPGFYLEGQSESGNVRAFAALNPCVAAGTTCSSGLDCCTGYCAIEPGAAQGTCTDQVPECARTNERCTTSADCCAPESSAEPANSCIAGYCGFVRVE